MQVLANYTTLELGGPARQFVTACSSDELVELVQGIDASDGELLVLGGGSNLVVADEGFDGTVVHVATRGIEQRDSKDGESVYLVVQAGEPWDDVVAYSIEHGLGGIECLSGIPGSCGATPIQNVGAYGASVDDVVTRVRALDRTTGALVDLTRDACGFGYRTSMFKRTGRFVVTEVELCLVRDQRSAPIRYAELARKLAVAVGARAPAALVREVVVELRRGKGMVIDSSDPDSRSAGSFFTNPILDHAAAFDEVCERIYDRLGGDAPTPPSWVQPDGRVKLPAAWLIERAGFGKGFGNGSVGISTKHTLALVNRGGGTTRQLLALAREIQDGVRDAFGIDLHIEPVVIAQAAHAGRRIE